MIGALKCKLRYFLVRFFVPKFIRAFLSTRLFLDARAPRAVGLSVGLDVRKYVIIRGGDDTRLAYYFYGHFG